MKVDRKVCRCRNVYASQIIKEIKAGAHKLEIIEEKTGAMSWCGGCIENGAKRHT